MTEKNCRIEIEGMEWGKKKKEKEINWAEYLQN